MYYKVSDFISDWKIESEATLKVLNNLTDASLSQKVSPEGRTLGYLAWHIALAIGEMLTKVGINVDSPAEDAPVPATAEEIRQTYEKASNSIIKQISENWTDETLKVEDNMYGEMWSRSYTITGLILHQIHHRGQMTILMRQAGLMVPGIYGPSKEEWAQMGMPALP